MSVFRVKLNNIAQGLMDIDPSTGLQFTTSKQRQVYVMGPKKINRLLRDGDTFTDCNYWKKFAYPQATYANAFIEVVTDDGSVYSDVESENTFAVGATFSSVGTSYTTDNTLNFVTTYGGPARFLQISNTGGQSMVVELNGDTNVTLTIASGEAQIFNTGDLAITQIRLKSSSSTTTAQIVGSVRSAVNS
jgi:hypothetical protein